uniref:Oxidoreductase n=1 Tax=Loa loa TaxID=7209 RepID=A0A1I7VPM0_LOALO
MFLFTILFIILPLLLYAIYELLGRKLTSGEIDRKAVLITGCGSGFGRDLVKRCLQNGLIVFAGCRRATSVNELEESNSSINQGRLYAFQMDVTDDESVRKSRRIVDNVLREKNLVFHALINNAGVRGNIFYDDFLTLDDYREVWDVNTCGVIRVTQTFRDLIKKSRHELQPYGVNVIEIIPGSFESGMQSSERLIKMLNKVWYRAPQKLRDEYGYNYNDKAKEFTKELQQNIVEKDSTWVIDSYYEAIVAKRPKLLYRIGWDVLITFYPYSFLPLRLQLYVMKFLMHLNGAPSPAITSKNIRSESPKILDN